MSEPTGDCYEAAGSYMLHADRHGYEDTLLLVHGVVSGQGPLAGQRFDHAWIESFDAPVPMVIDRSNGKNLVLPKAAYYHAGQIDADECHYYSHKEFLAKVIEHEHYGPWEESS